MSRLQESMKRKKRLRDAAAQVYGLNRCETCDIPTSLPLDENGICPDCRKKFQEELDVIKAQKVLAKKREKYQRLLAEKQRREAIKRENLYKDIEGSWS